MQLECCDLDVCDFWQCEFKLYKTPKCWETFKNTIITKNENENTVNQDIIIQNTCEKGVYIIFKSKAAFSDVFVFPNQNLDLQGAKNWEAEVYRCINSRDYDSFWKIVKNARFNVQDFEVEPKLLFWVCVKAHLVPVARNKDWINNVD